MTILAIIVFIIGIVVAMYFLDKENTSRWKEIQNRYTKYKDRIGNQHSVFVENLSTVSCNDAMLELEKRIYKLEMKNRNYD